MNAGKAYARVGLLGNPSDGYGGHVLAMTVPQLHAKVVAEPADGWHFADTQLIEATVTALRERRPELVAEPARLSFTTTVPRQVGLSGSSAIIIAALRALAKRTGHVWDLVELAKTALEVETEVLGWAAGPQDRVVQAYEGLVDMDFASPWLRDGYVRCDEAQLPPLFVAWDRSPGNASDIIHSQVRERWLAGERLVVDVMKRFAELAAEGSASLRIGTAPAVWPALMNEAFALRSQIWTIRDIDRILVEVGQAGGAGVAFAGSGGAVVGSVDDPALLAPLANAYDAIDAGFLRINP